MAVFVFAMSLGLPIVATDVGFIAEVVGNCIFVPAGDVSAMTQILQKLVDQPQLRTELSQKSEELSRGYSLRRNAIEYESMILEVLVKADKCQLAGGSES